MPIVPGSQIPSQFADRALLLSGVIVWLVCAGSNACAAGNSDSLIRVDSIAVDIQPPADTSGSYDIFDWFVNFTHWTTRSSVVRSGWRNLFGDSLLVSAENIDEFNYYLRQLGIFESVEVAQPDPETGVADVFVGDGWSLVLEPYSKPGDETEAWLFGDDNVFGYATTFVAGASLESPTDSAWRTVVKAGNRDLFRTGWRTKQIFEWSRHRWALEAEAMHPFYSQRTHYSGGGDIAVSNGRQPFFFRDPEDPRSRGFVSDTSERWSIDGSAWFGSSNRETDQFFTSLAAHANRTEVRSGTHHPAAFENTIGLFASIGSLRRDLQHTPGYGFEGPKVEPIGAAGRVIAGKTFTIADGTDDIVYIGADAHKAIFHDPLYLYAAVEAGTGWKDGETSFTQQRGVLSGATSVGPGYVAFKALESIIWRWDRYVWRPVSTSGIQLRGYDDTEVVGQNIVGLNVEYRLFPLIDLPIWNLGFTAFYDVASIWNQGERFAGSRFHNAVGIGARIGTPGNIDGGFLRIDVAWNFDRDEIGGIGLGVSEAFDLFGTVKYIPPAPFTP